MYEQYRLDSKKLNKMFFVQALLLIGSVVIIMPLLMAFKLERDLVIVLTAIIELCGVNYFLIKRYQKKLEIKISYKINSSFNLLSFFKYMMMTIGASFIIGLMMNWIMDLLAGVIVFETPDFSMKYSTISNIFFLIMIVVVGPIIEELIYRGIVLGSLKKYGNTLAVIIVSIIFSLMHSNLPQAIPTFVVSIFLCIVTLKSGSIVPAIAIHIINNGLGLLEYIQNDSIQLFNNVITIIIIIIGLFLIIKNYKHVKKVKCEYKIREYFYNWPGILFLIYYTASILETIKIK